MACSLARLAACDGVRASRTCSLAWSDERVAETGGLVGDTLVLRREPSILVETSGMTGTMVGDVVRTGRRSGRLVDSESGDGPDGGYDGVCARGGYDVRAVGWLGGTRGAVLPKEAERLKEPVL